MPLSGSPLLEKREKWATRRGLVASPELWRWSSFRAYAFGEVGAVRVNEWQVLKMKTRPQTA